MVGRRKNYNHWSSRSEKIKHDHFGYKSLYRLAAFIQGFILHLLKSVICLGSYNPPYSGHIETKLLLQS
jgi:hypothetical protein